jgi:hypothetical protein
MPITLTVDLPTVLSILALLVSLAGLVYTKLSANATQRQAKTAELTLEHARIQAIEARYDDLLRLRRIVRDAPLEEQAGYIHAYYARYWQTKRTEFTYWLDRQLPHETIAQSLTGIAIDFWRNELLTPEETTSCDFGWAHFQDNEGAFGDPWFNEVVSSLRAVARKADARMSLEINVLKLLETVIARTDSYRVVLAKGMTFEDYLASRRELPLLGLRETLDGKPKRSPEPSRVRPNPSLKRSTNGRPPGPGRWYSVHFHRPGPGVLPLAPA